nr:hypothetical protein GCM10020093_006240 [Planobispora longispora]
MHAELLVFDVDAAVAQVGDRADRAGQVLDGLHGVAEVRDQSLDGALRQRPAPVADRGERLGRRLLDLGEVVALLALLAAELGVGDPGLLGVAVPLASRERSSPYRPRMCSSTSLGTRAETFSRARPSLA